ncbi:hypothetical protein D3C79_1020060 [compost metagenome]
MAHFAIVRNTDFGQLFAVGFIAAHFVTNPKVARASCQAIRLRSKLQAAFAGLVEGSLQACRG